MIKPFVLIAICLVSLPVVVFAQDVATAKTLFEAQEFEQARDLLLALDRLDEEAEGLYYLGRSLLNLNDANAAVEVLERALELDAGNADYHYELGSAYAAKIDPSKKLKALGLAKKMRKQWLTTIELDPDNIDARFGLLQYYLQAPRIAGGSKKKAYKQAQEISQRDELRGLLATAQVASARDDQATARKVYEKAVAAYPQNADVYLSYGLALTADGHYQEAVTLYERYLKQDSDHFPILYQLGRTASIAGDFLAQGERALLDYLEYDPKANEPGHDWANYRLGLILEAQGDADRAAQQYRNALELNANHGDAKKALAKLDKQSR